MCTWLWVALLGGLMFPLVLAAIGWLFDNNATKYTAEMEALEQECAEWKRKYEDAEFDRVRLSTVLAKIREAVPSDN